MNKPINLNDLAMDISSIEGGKESISIAQTKEVLGILFKRVTLADLCRIWFKYNG